MTGRLLRCFSIIRHHRRRSSTFIPAIAFIYALFMFLFTLSSTRHTSSDFCFLHIPYLFQVKLSFLFISPIQLGSSRILLNRHSASTTFYPTLVILDAFDHRHSTSTLSTTKYLELLDLF